MGIFKQTVYNGNRFVRVSPGDHPAILVALVDLGDQPNWKDNQWKWWRQIYLCWEVMGGPSDGGLIGVATFPDLGEKSKLRVWLGGRRGRTINPGEEIDLAAEVGKPCTLIVTPRNQFSEVSGMAPPPEGFNRVPRVRPFTLAIEDYVRKGGNLPSWLPKLYGDTIEDCLLKSKQVAGRFPNSSRAKPRDDDGWSPTGDEPSTPSGDSESIPF